MAFPKTLPQGSPSLRKSFFGEVLCQGSPLPGKSFAKKVLHQGGLSLLAAVFSQQSSRGSLPATQASSQCTSPRNAHSGIEAGSAPLARCCRDADGRGPAHALLRFFLPERFSCFEAAFSMPWKPVLGKPSPRELVFQRRAGSKPKCKGWALPHRKASLQRAPCQNAP